jgi:hypothetical protein
MFISVAPLMEKLLTPTGVLIRFYYALSDPALCTGLRLTGDNDTLITSRHWRPKNTDLAKHQEIVLPVFLLAV